MRLERYIHTYIQENRVKRFLRDDILMLEESKNEPNYCKVADNLNERENKNFGKFR